ncbi:invasion associated locus B family protein [Aliivibrio fischeri]|uniref:hypothetical protein n=1 Tax=Aliivibrio fischeri TaxID=668 RepID=UPI00084BFDF7|nr:hypothetical protein [Aliivibrio fischeri]OED52784.1 hypothetical protein BEI46_18300 [Aliivibrio fischeri]
MKMKTLLSLLLLILSSELVYAGTWSFDKSQDEFTGKINASITSPNYDVKFSCSNEEVGNGSIYLIVSYDDFIGESGGLVTEWVTNEKKRGEYHAHGFKSSVQGYFELLSTEDINTLLKDSNQSRKDKTLIQSQKQWEMINAMKSGNTIKFRTVAYDDVYAVSNIVNLKGFTKAFNQFKKTCGNFKEKDIKPTKKVIKKTQSKDWLINKNCNFITSVFILDEIENLKPMMSNVAYSHAVSCFSDD